MATLSEDLRPKPAPAKPLTDLDFHSGAQIKELNQLIQEYEARNPSFKGVPELHHAKDMVFSLLGLVQKSDEKLPSINRYLILYGGIQQGTLHVDLSPLLLPGGDYDMDFTLLVPILNTAGVPVTLDMQHSPPGHTQISLQAFNSDTLHHWANCCSGDEAYLSAALVSDWFFRAFAAVAKEVRVEDRNGVTSVIVTIGRYRILYDIVPVIELKGWPEVGQPWLTQAHFWDGKLRDEEVTGGFYLLPSISGTDWILAFTASELLLRQVLPVPLVHAFRVAVAIFGAKHCHPLIAYHLFTLVLRSCERLPTSYLSQEENSAHALLGLLDDFLASLTHRLLPNYFLPQWNILEGFSRHTMEHLATEVAGVRANPAHYLRQAVEGVKEALRLAKVFRKGPSSPSITPSLPHPPL